MLDVISRNEDLASLNDEALTSYLRSKQWFLARRINENLSLWEISVEGTRHQILVPHNLQFSDYNEMLAKAVIKLQEYEQRIFTDILHDIKTIDTDILSVRLSDASNTMRLPIQHGVKAMHGVLNLLSVTARYAVNPRPFYDGQLPKDAARYMDGVKLGQTQPGSFIFNVVLPEFNTSDYEIVAPVNSPPFPQQVAESLRLALERLVQYIKDGAKADNQTVELFQAGISANFCEAVVMLFGVSKTLAQIESIREDPALKIDIFLKFASYTRSFYQNKSSNVQFSFTINDVPALLDLARRLRELSLGGISISGYVIKLQRPQENRRGAITLETTIYQKTRRVHIELDEKDYITAGQANLEKLLVTCTGNLVQKSNSFLLENVADFRLT